MNKIFLMKKLILLALLISFGLRSNAQATATFTLVTGGCDTNQVLVVHFSGGTSLYQVEWIGGTFSGYAYHLGITGTTDTLYNYAGGTTFVYVYDSTIGLVDTGSFTEALSMTFAFAPVPSFCGTSTATSVTVSGGTPPYTYNWFPVYNPYTSSGTTNPITLASGIYGVTITDATGCVTNSNIETVDSAGYAYAYYDTLEPTATYSINVTSTNANCTDGKAAVTSISSGAVSPVSYAWSDGATTPSISGLIMGGYYVTVTDAVGCVASSYAYISQVTVISPMITPTSATCIATNGAAIGFGSGGTTPYTYLWSNGATTQSISGLSAGYYDLTVTDANGCIGTTETYVSSSTPITVTYVTAPSACTTPTGSATLTISGGTAPYDVTWYTTPVQTGASASSLLAGNYYFTITDAMGCTQSGTVTVPPVDVINLSFSSTPATCVASDGSVFVAASGGYTPYTYSWNTGATTATLSAIPYGTYTATVTDAHGCKASNCQLVPYTSPLELGLSSTPASCLYTHDGSITANASLGTPPYTYSPGGSSPGPVTITGLATDPYWVYVTDAMGCTAEQYTYVDYNVLDSSCFCVLQGNVYDDLAVDCSPTGDPGIQNIQLHASGFGYTYTNPEGYYYFLLPSGTYTISQTVLSIYPLSPCQSNNFSYTSVAATGCYQTINFADTLTPIHDMHICTWDYTKPIPGFSYTQTTLVTNNGTVTEPGILASYVPDGQLLSPTFVPSGIFNGAPYYYNTADSFPSLTPGAGQEFLETYNVPANIPLGTNVITKDTVAYTAPMSNWLNDYSPWNNVDYFTTTTVGAYDPNFKEVSPAGTGTEGFIPNDDTVLEYMIHFQNIGTYMAQNVVVIDTLDPNLQWTTLRPEFLSNKGVVDINDQGIATFTFSNIDLPPVSSEPIASNGMFTYTVKIKPALAYGTHIRNRASIYFDFNAPVMTNQTLTTIGGPLKTPTVPGTTANNSFTIFPNPAQNSFTAIINVNTAGTYYLKITDVTGKTEIAKTIGLLAGTQNISVDANRLAPGVYFVTLTGNDNLMQTQKLVIMK